MKKILLAVFICFLNLSASAIDYNDFPPNLQQVLNERTAELKSKGGICVAGSIIMSDGAYIGSGKDVQVNFLKGIDESLDVYAGGWFIMDRTLRLNQYPGPAKLVLRAFGYDPVDASIAVVQGQITYEEFVMQKTSPENLAKITGIVTNDQDEPVSDVIIGLRFPYAYSMVNSEPLMSIKTETDGQYSFENLPITQYYLCITAPPGYAYASTTVTPAKGKTTIKDIKLYPNLSILIDYVYQEDANNYSFTNGDLRTGTLEWINGIEGVDFSEGRVEWYEPNSLRDIELRQSQNTLQFQVSYANGRNGFYDAGDVNFESVTEAAQTGYSTTAKPCVIGHTYVVRTYENKYAKFVVRSISGKK